MPRKLRTATDAELCPICHKPDGSNPSCPACAGERVPHEARMLGNRLIQFQCQREGTLFYYQTGNNVQYARTVIDYCPVCGSTLVSPTGREFPPVAENSPLEDSPRK